MADEMSGGDTSDVSADIPEDVPEDAAYPEETLDEIRNAITNESSSYEYEGVTDEIQRNIADEGISPRVGMDLNSDQNTGTKDTYSDKIKKTPINNGKWSNERGEPTWIPHNKEMQERLKEFGTNGIEYHNGEPDLTQFATAEYCLPEHMYLSPDKEQFSECNNFLQDAVERDATFRKNFTEDELFDIEDGIKPYGYTWHHCSESGKM